jgi:anaerobic selenocysteine-containing dehydrogenase
MIWGQAKYLMMTVHRHDQFNTTIYGLNDRYRGVYNGRRVIFMNSGDVKESGLQQGRFVDLTSHYQGETRVAKHFMVAPYNIPRGCTATYFPEANVLVPINNSADSTCRDSQTDPSCPLDGSFRQRNLFVGKSSTNEQP